MDFNKFIEQAKPLFQWYRILSSKEITVVDNNRCEYVAIAGEYLLNRSYNNEIYNRIYYLVIILSGERQMINSGSKFLEKYSMKV